MTGDKYVFQGVIYLLCKKAGILPAVNFIRFIYILLMLNGFIWVVLYLILFLFWERELLDL